MGNPHHNTWGGKNNSWGNKNRKKKDEEPEYRYVPNKLFNVIVGGMMIYILGSAGLSIITDTFSNISDAFSKSKEAVEYMKNKDTISKGDYKFNITDELELEAEDVSDILEYLSENLNVITSDEYNIIFLDYSAVNNNSKYKNKIISRLDNYNNIVTFVLITNKFNTKEEINEELDRIVSLIEDNSKLLSDTKFSQVYTQVSSNRPNIGELNVLITFYN